MYLKNLCLQNFRNYTKSEFNFSEGTTFIVGPNTSGKTNLIEAIHLLSKGKGYKSENDVIMIGFDKELARVKGEVETLELSDLARLTHIARPAQQTSSNPQSKNPSLNERRLQASLPNNNLNGSSFSCLANDQARNDRRINLEVVLTNGQVAGVKSQYKKFLVNGVSKRRIDFCANLTCVLFNPEDLEIIIDSPSLRRNFLDDVLEQTDRDYRLALVSYSKALRQRNALLEKTREEGIRNEKLFEYWDTLLIKNGGIITRKREEFIEFINSQKKEIINFKVFYDKSIISVDRLMQYKDAEIGSGVTLVGPHRDDFKVFMKIDKGEHDVKFFGSRGQQRLVILQLKLLQLLFVENALGERPTLLLDDIFSELDESHIKLVSELIGKQQTIITTTHEEFISVDLLNKAEIIRLDK